MNRGRKSPFLTKTARREAPALAGKTVKYKVQGMRSVSHPPHWYGVAVRILLLTFIGTLLCFCVTLLLSLIATVAVAAIRGMHPDMRIAYRHFAVPMAVIEATVIFIFASAMEIRHYHRARALSAIERAG